MPAAVQAAPGALRSGFKSHTHGADNKHFSGLVFEDQPGKELVQLHAERDASFSAEHDLAPTAGNDERVAVVGKAMLNVGRVYEVTVGSIKLGEALVGTSQPPWTFSWFGGAVAGAVGHKSESVLGTNSTWTIGLCDRVTAGIDARFAIIGDVRVVGGYSLDMVAGKRVELTAGSVTDRAAGPRVTRVGGDASWNAQADHWHEVRGILTATGGEQARFRADRNTEFLTLGKLDVEAAGKGIYLIANQSLDVDATEQLTLQNATDKTSAAISFSYGLAVTCLVGPGSDQQVGFSVQGHKITLLCPGKTHAGSQIEIEATGLTIRSDAPAGELYFKGTKIDLQSANVTTTGKVTFKN